MNIRFEVEVNDGDVYIDGNFVGQLCFDGESIGCAVADFINELEDATEIYD